MQLLIEADNLLEGAAAVLYTICFYVINDQILQSYTYGYVYVAKCLKGILLINQINLVKTFKENSSHEYFKS